MKNNNNLIFATLTAIFLTACGGGDSSEKATEINKPPTVSIVDLIAKEGSQVSLKAKASDDASGLSYSWLVSSVSGLELIDVNAETLLFNSPFINDDSISISVSVTVTDEGGLTATQSAIVIIENDMPVVTFSNDLTVLEKETIPLMASIDGGSEIESYSWSVTGLPGTTVSNRDNIAELTIPNTTSDAELLATLTVIDSDGDEASASINISVSQIFEPLVISGLITDSPVANSKVSVFVGERRIETVANQKGLYTIPLKIDDDEMQDLIKIQGMGVGEQSHVGLISILGTASDLITQSGADNLLESGENFSVNVTNITTAKYSLMMNLNNNIPITTEGVLTSLMAELNMSEVFETAGLIKVAIDYMDNPEVDLPEGITNTLELVSSIPNLNAFEKTVPTDLVGQALSEILSDETLIEVVQFDVPEALYNVDSSSGNRVDTWQFFSTGFGSHGAHEFTWTREQNKVLGEYVIAPAIDRSETLETEQGESSFNFESTAKSFELTMVSSVDGFVEYVVRQNVEKKYSDSYIFSDYGIEDPSGDHTNTYYYTAYLPTAKKEFPSVVGFSAVMPVSLIYTKNEETGDFSLEDDKFQFNTDGTGHTQYSDYDFNWVLKGENLTLTQKMANKENIITTYNVFEEGDGLWPISRNELNSDTEDVTSLGRVISGSAIWTDNNVPGIYGYPGDDEVGNVDAFWFELHQNGDADTISTRDRNNDGVLIEDEIIKYYGKWKIDNNNLVITRVVRVNSSESSPEHRVEDDEEWVQYHERVWDLISISGNTYGMLHKHKFTYGKQWPQYYKGTEESIYIDSRNIMRFEKPPVDLTNPQIISYGFNGASTSMSKENISKSRRTETVF